MFLLILTLVDGKDSEREKRKDIMRLNMPQPEPSAAT